MPVPFRRMPYDEMVDRFGSDKPDLRYGMELVDLADLFAGSGFNAFASVAADGGAIKALCAPGGGAPEPQGARQAGRGREGPRRRRTGVAGRRSRRSAPLAGRRSSCPTRSARASWRAPARRPGTWSASSPTAATGSNVALDGCRRDLAVRLDLIPEGRWEFCWYSEPPLFEWSEEEGRWVANHHPFTAPLTDDLEPDDGKGPRLRPRPERVRDRRRLDPDPRAGGAAGRLRRARAHTRRATGEVRAPAEGVPASARRRTAGSRWVWTACVMLLAGKDSLRDVTAFPKAQSGADPHDRGAGAGRPRRARRARDRRDRASPRRTRHERDSPRRIARCSARPTSRGS